MGNEGRAEVTRLRRDRDESESQATAAESNPAQEATITVDDANHTARALVVASINNQKVYQAAAAKPVAPLPLIVGNSNNPSLRRPDRG